MFELFIYIFKLKVMIIDLPSKYCSDFDVLRLVSNLDVLIRFNLLAGLYSRIRN